LSQPAPFLSRSPQSVVHKRDLFRGQPGERPFRPALLVGRQGPEHFVHGPGRTCRHAHHRPRTASPMFRSRAAGRRPAAARAVLFLSRNGNGRQVFCAGGLRAIIHPLRQNHSCRLFLISHKRKPGPWPLLAILTREADVTGRNGRGDGAHASASPSRMANRASSTRSWISSLAMMFAVWRLTVFTLRCIVRAIPFLVSPRAM